MSSDDASEPASPEFYLDQALATFERALELVDADDRPDLHGAILHDIAEVYESTGRVVEAVEMYRRSVESKRRRAAPAELLITLLVLASCLIDRAEFEEARALTEEAADVLARPDPGMSTSFRAGRAFALGVLWERLGDTGEEGAHRLALEAFTWSSTLYDGVVEAGARANALRAMARVQAVLGRDDEAAESLSRAVRCFEVDDDRDGQVVVLIDLGRLYQRRAAHSASSAAVPAPRTEEDAVPDVTSDVAAEAGTVDADAAGDLVADPGVGTIVR